MTALHKKLAHNIAQIVTKTDSKTVVAMFYNPETMTLRVIYRSGAGYDYFNVPEFAVVTFKKISLSSNVDIRSHLKQYYQRKRLDSNVSQAWLLLSQIETDVKNGMRQV